MSDFPPGVGPGFPSKGFVKGPSGSEAREADERCDSEGSVKPRKDFRRDEPGWGANEE